MLLIIVARSRVATFACLMREFGSEPDVKVIWDRRAMQAPPHTPNRRRDADPFDGRDYFVVRTADETAFQIA